MNAPHCPEPRGGSSLEDTLARLRDGQLDGSRRLDLPATPGERLVRLPPEVFRLADTLEVLNLAGHALTSLPDDLPRLHRLKVIFGSGNPFTELPPVLGRCGRLEMVGFRGCGLERVVADALPPQLRWLTLTDNRLEELPPALGERPRLEKLMLSGNRLQALPASLAHSRRLALLRLAANPALAELPEGLLDLPELAWLALAGTALVPETEATCTPGPALNPIPWQQLQLGPVLGQGASGVIHAATWRPQGEHGPAHAVALKLFKGTITSDGLPGCEMAAALAAGRHPHLLGALGPLTGHPLGQAGLLLPRVPAGHQPLAEPPSLDSCSRDIYPAGWRLPGDQALAWAAELAQALAYLHAGQVLHGDFYGHNVLCAPQGGGPALLSDFGAATPLAGLPPTLQRQLQALDTRAWGLLLSELLAAAPGLPNSTVAQAQGWVAQATQPVPAQRPAMAACAAAASALAASPAGCHAR